MRGLTIAQPLTAIAFLIGGLALAGMPPFSMFASELMILSALVTQTFASDTLHVGRFLTITVADDVRSLGMVMGVSIFAVVLFGGLTYRLASMMWGTPPDHVKRGERWNLGHVSLGATAIALVVFGLMLPAPLRTLLNQASQVLITTVTP